ncbi:MAG TPA: hypothetical protein VGK22_16920, partial [Candidatus Angelobacter sp.]
EERRRLKMEYGELFDAIAALLFRHDPINIAAAGAPKDEYEPETGTILPRLKECSLAADVRRVVHEEFVRWFDPRTAGPENAYTEIAVEIWAMMQKDQQPVTEGRTANPNSVDKKRAMIDLAIVLAFFALCFLAVPVLTPLFRHGRSLATVLAAATFQVLVEGAAPFTLMLVRRETFSSYGFIRRNLGKSLGLALLLALLYNAGLSWHVGALLWIPLRNQPSVHNSLSLGFPLSIIGLASVVFAWGFVEGFFGIYFSRKVNLAFGHSSTGWLAPGVLAFALFNGVVHLFVGQSLEGFITSFASGYAIAVIPAVTGNAWGGTLVQTLTNAVGHL